MKENPLDSYLRTHHLDQQAAGAATFGDTIATFYQHLRLGEVPAAAALELTKTFLAALVYNSKEQNNGA